MAKNTNQTEQQYDAAKERCREVFVKKTQDYGTSWRILRPSSITDQIFIKAQRIRSIEDSGENKVGESIDNEFIGIVNYGVIGLVQLQDGPKAQEMDPAEIIERWDREMQQTRDLMMAKNHDYGEAWRDMRISSYTDLILMKVLRTKQIENNEGVTQISEGIDANYRDMINYAIFGLIRLSENP
jgi:hypothetical protein